MEPDLRLLRSFATVAEERHFGRAAERLGIAQPPLSQQIRKLEAQLGTEVIDRSSRPVGLTDAGTALLAEARLALAHADRAVAAARRAAQGQLGHLSIGAMQAALSGIVPRVLRTYRARYPDVSLSVTEEGSREQVSRLLEDRLDVGFIRVPVDEPALVVEPIVDDPLTAVLPADHPLAARELVQPAELAAEPFLLAARAGSPTTYADVVAFFRLVDAQPRVLHDTSTIQTVLALVAAGFGVSLLPASFAHLRRDGVVFRPVAPPLPQRPLAVAWRAANRSQALGPFLAVTRETAAESAAEP